MDKTKREILKTHFQVIANKISGITFEDAEGNNGYDWVYDAMDEYAEQEAKSYASWLSNQVIAGRTSTKLWDDYQEEIGEHVDF